jgi:hypothetical protein
MHPHKCPYIHDRKPNWQCVEEPKPESVPEPELLTMAQAIAKAVAMGGGEVVREKGACYRGMVVCTVEKGAMTINEDYWDGLNHFADASHAVRPLPPVTFGWPEALERLQRGESVNFMEHGRSYCIAPRITAYCERADSSITIDLPELTDKQFTATDK